MRDPSATPSLTAQPHNLLLPLSLAVQLAPSLGPQGPTSSPLPAARPCPAPQARPAPSARPGGAGRGGAGAGRVPPAGAGTARAGAQVRAERGRAAGPARPWGRCSSSRSAWATAASSTAPASRWPAPSLCGFRARCSTEVSPRPAVPCRARGATRRGGYPGEGFAGCPGRGAPWGWCRGAAGCPFPAPGLPHRGPGGADGSNLLDYFLLLLLFAPIP